VGLGATLHLAQAPSKNCVWLVVLLLCTPVPAIAKLWVV
jgi:hypothetical protein